MSKKNLEVRISSRTVNEGNQKNQVWEGTINILGTRPTKLVRRANNTTQFATRSAVLTSARTLAKTLGYCGISEPVLKAAKKSAKKTSKKTSTKKKSTK